VTGPERVGVAATVGDAARAVGVAAAAAVGLLAGGFVGVAPPAGAGVGVA